MLKLPQLQTQVKSDPEGYKDDFITQYRRFLTESELFRVNPSKKNDGFSELITFLGQTANSFPEESADFPAVAMSLLNDYFTVLDSDIRKCLIQALQLLRSKEFIYLDPIALSRQFFQLMSLISEDAETLSDYLHTLSLNYAKIQITNTASRQSLIGLFYSLVSNVSDDIVTKHVLEICSELWKTLPEIRSSTDLIRIIQLGFFHSSRIVNATALAFFLDKPNSRDIASSSKSKPLTQLTLPNYLQVSTHAKKTGKRKRLTKKGSTMISASNHVKDDDDDDDVDEDTDKDRAKRRRDVIRQKISLISNPYDVYEKICEVAYQLLKHPSYSDNKKTNCILIIIDYIRLASNISAQMALDNYNPSNAHTINLTDKFHVIITYLISHFRRMNDAMVDLKSGYGILTCAFTSLLVSLSSTAGVTYASLEHYLRLITTHCVNYDVDDDVGIMALSTISSLLNLSTHSCRHETHLQTSSESVDELVKDWINVMESLTPKSTSPALRSAFRRLLKIIRNCFPELVPKKMLGRVRMDDIVDENGNDDDNDEEEEEEDDDDKPKKRKRDENDDDNDMYDICEEDLVHRSKSKLNKIENLREAVERKNHEGKFEHKLHGGGLTNTEQKRFKNFKMVSKSRRLRAKIQRASKSVSSTNRKKTVLLQTFDKHERRKRRRA